MCGRNLSILGHSTASILASYCPLFLWLWNYVRIVANMTNATMARSIEEKVEDWAKQQFAPGSYFTKTQSINHEIDEALHNAPSKTGGSGNNYPDIKFLLQSPQGNYIPVMIEVKGTKGALIKRNDAGIPDNVNKSGEPNYTNIAKYAANGAIHYANAILRLAPSYKEVIAIGVNGYEERTGDIQHELSVWYIIKGIFFQGIFFFLSSLSSFVPPERRFFTPANSQFSLFSCICQKK